MNNLVLEYYTILIRKPVPMIRISIYLYVLICKFSSSILCAHIENNAYKSIVLSFSSSISSEDINVDKFQRILEKASEYLYTATKKRSYLEEFILTTPSSWTTNLCHSSEYVDSIATQPSIYIFKPYENNALLTTKHSKKCGEKGDIMYIPLHWFNGNPEDLAREFVQQWAIYRYGVFEEIPISSSCYTADGKTWQYTGCYDINVSADVFLNSNGLPECVANDGYFSNSDMQSSIMFTAKPSNVTAFCEGSGGSFPHNPIAPTLHNVLCDGKPVWDVIKNSEDFKYGKNPPIKSTSFQPIISIKCYKEKSRNLFFIVQNSSMADITEIVKEIRFSMLRFFGYDIHYAADVNLLVFSDEKHTKNAEFVNLNFRELQKAHKLLASTMRVMDVLKDTCALCGLQKALGLLKSEEKDISLIYILLASAVKSIDSQEFSRTLTANKYKFTCIIIEDITIEQYPEYFLKTIYSTGGEIFKIPGNPVAIHSHLVMAFSHIVKPNNHAEDDVTIVHEKLIPRVDRSVVDEFSLDTQLHGQLIYTLKCNGDKDRVEISTLMNCSNSGYLSESYLCAMTATLQAENSSHTKWSVFIKDKGGVDALACSSLATIRMENKEQHGWRLRGWFNHNMIKPGDNIQIIYAELLKDYEPFQDAIVEAHIYGPSSSSSDSVDIIKLRDNGNGDPDMKPGDGIYSRYFTNFKMPGLFTVLIHMYSDVITSSDQQMTTASKNEKMLLSVLYVGTFCVIEAVPEIDIYPPNRIGDLKVISVNSENKFVTLQWTAPGDDYDSGKAKSYQVFLSTVWQDLTDEIISRGTVQHLAIIKSPTESGMMEKLQITIDKNTYVLFYLAIRAKDLSGNMGKVSNFVQIVMFEKDNTMVTENVSVSDNRTVLVNETISNAVFHFDQYHIILISICAVMLLIFICINIIWLKCYKKHKRTEKNKVDEVRYHEVQNVAHLNDQNKSSTHSQETDTREQYDLSYVQHNRGPNVSIISGTALDSGYNDVPQYAVSSKVKSRHQMNSHHSETPQIARRNSTENDMGYV